MFFFLKRRVAMKKRYQIDRERAVQNFQKQASHSEQSLQLKLPFKEVAAALQDGVGHLMRQAGLELMQLIMEEEVRQLAGECCQRREPGQHYRWGGEKGFRQRPLRAGLDSRYPPRLLNRRPPTAGGVLHEAGMAERFLSARPPHNMNDKR